MQSFGLNLIAIVFLAIFILLIIWLLVKVSSMIDMIKKDKNEEVDKQWCQKQLSIFTDEELRELIDQLKLNE